MAQQAFWRDTCHKYNNFILVFGTGSDLGTGNFSLRRAVLQSSTGVRTTATKAKKGVTSRLVLRLANRSKLALVLAFPQTEA